ncbi:uncharacterized protein LOC114527452 [Dendronephthya gigantea]|uniref:uncharacterized protein LOC114527452 n=1 Tax=Dendronephthya gigantea TaxID=151771 RepID=UPI00106CBBD3|nr:uncharacterized protein LOC114527452 [Dendronephthya gigantea]
MFLQSFAAFMTILVVILATSSTQANPLPRDKELDLHKKKGEIFHRIPTVDNKKEEKSSNGEGDSINSHNVIIVNLKNVNITFGGDVVIRPQGIKMEQAHRHKGNSSIHRGRHDWKRPKIPHHLDTELLLLNSQRGAQPTGAKPDKGKHSRARSFQKQSARDGEKDGKIY